MSESINPNAPDAPIHHLLSIKNNPMVRDFTQQQLADLIKTLRAYSTSPQTLTAALVREGGKRKETEAQRKRRETLASI